MFLYNMQSYNNTNANACAMIGLTHFAMLPCSSYNTDCPTTEYSVSRYFLIAEESCEHQRGQWLGGSRGILPKKMLKSWCFEIPFLLLWEENMSKMFLKLIDKFKLIDWLNWLHGFAYKYSIVFYISHSFLKFSDISLSLVYSVRCSCISFRRILLKIQ